MSLKNALTDLAAAVGAAGLRNLQLRITRCPDGCPEVAIEVSMLDEGGESQCSMEAVGHGNLAPDERAATTDEAAFSLAMADCLASLETEARDRMECATDAGKLAKAVTS